MDVTEIFELNFDSDAKILVNRGGTRSSKTYSINQICFLWLTTGQYGVDKYIQEGIWTTVRKYRTNLDNTCIRDFEEILRAEGWYDAVVHNKTKKTYKYKNRLV